MSRVPYPAQVKFVRAGAGVVRVIANSKGRSQANKDAHRMAQRTARQSAEERIADAERDLGRKLRREEAADIRRRTWAAMQHGQS